MGDAAKGLPNRRLGLVIGSGGLKCAASIGLWRVLEEAGIRPDMIVGCSGGSLFASCMALGWDAATIQERVFRDWTATITARPYYRSFLRAALPRVFGFSERFGLIDDRHLNAALRRQLGDPRIEDLPIPLRITATDVRSGERVVLSRWPVAEAVRASIALPVLFRPWPIEGRLLSDGASSDPLPLSVAIREGCDILVAMGFESTHDDRLDSLWRLIHQHTVVAGNHLLRSTFAFYSLVHHAEVIPVMPRFDRPVRLGDVAQVPSLIEEGERSAREQLPYLQRLLSAA
ncbi:MAG TPA: patatin-like phospholipase family protein [Thermoanaerobaculia bacterium]|nr:patatin-like phospholipase family protein [Thermoanaerobaculia bacterium]